MQILLEQTEVLTTMTGTHKENHCKDKRHYTEKKTQNKKETPNNTKIMFKNRVYWRNRCSIYKKEHLTNTNPRQPSNTSQQQHQIFTQMYDSANK